MFVLEYSLSIFEQLEIFAKFGSLLLFWILFLFSTMILLEFSLLIVERLDVFPILTSVVGFSFSLPKSLLSTTILSENTLVTISVRFVEVDLF